MINELLQKLGFSDKEIAVYLAILKAGDTSPTHIAATTGINRTTVYSVSKELIKRGVIDEDLGTSKGHLVARAPEDLALLIQKDEEDLRTKKQLLTEAIKELSNFTQQTKYTIPKIVFIPEDDLKNYLYKQTPKWNESLQTEDPSKTWWGFQDPTFVEKYQEWIDWYWKRSNPLDVSLKLLTNQADIETTMKTKGYERRKIEFWAKSDQFTATTWICGSYVIIISTNQNPHYLIEIHDKVLAHNLREVFKGIWTTIYPPINN